MMQPIVSAQCPCRAMYQLSPWQMDRKYECQAIWHRPTCQSCSVLIITFRVRRSRGEMYIGHGRSCVCVSVWLSLAALPHYSTDPNVTWGNGRGFPLVVHCWANLQSVHEFRCYGTIAPNAKCQRVLVLAPWLVLIVEVKV